MEELSRVVNNSKVTPNNVSQQKTRGDVTKLVRDIRRRFESSAVAYTHTDYDSRGGIVNTTEKGGLNPEVVSDRSLSILGGQPGANKSVLYPFRLAQGMHKCVVIATPFMKLSTMNAKYMNMASKKSGIPLVEDYDTLTPLKFDMKSVVITTAATVLSRCMANPSTYLDAVIIVDETHTYDEHTFILNSLLKARRISWSALLASATPDAEAATIANFNHTSEHAAVTEEPYEYVHTTKWSAHDEDKPWSANRIHRSTLLFNDDEEIAEALTKQYAAKGIRAFNFSTRCDLREYYNFIFTVSPTDKYVIIARSEHTLGYAFPVLDVVDSTRTVGASINLDGTAEARERKLHERERIQQKNRTACIDDSQKGMYHYPTGPDSPLFRQMTGFGSSLREPTFNSDVSEQTNSEQTSGNTRATAHGLAPFLNSSASTDNIDHTLQSSSFLNEPCSTILQSELVRPIDEVHIVQTRDILRLRGGSSSEEATSVELELDEFYLSDSEVTRTEADESFGNARASQLVSEVGNDLDVIVVQDEPCFGGGLLSYAATNSQPALSRSVGNTSDDIFLISATEYYDSSVLYSEPDIARSVLHPIPTTTEMRSAVYKDYVKGYHISHEEGRTVIYLLIMRDDLGYGPGTVFCAAPLSESWNSRCIKALSYNALARVQAYEDNPRLSDKHEALQALTAAYEGTVDFGRYIKLNDFELVIHEVVVSMSVPWYYTTSSFTAFYLILIKSYFSASAIHRGRDPLSRSVEDKPPDELRRRDGSFINKLKAKKVNIQRHNLNDWYRAFLFMPPELEVRYRLDAGDFLSMKPSRVDVLGDYAQEVWSPHKYTFLYKDSFSIWRPYRYQVIGFDAMYAADTWNICVFVKHIDFDVTPDSRYYLRYSSWAERRTTYVDYLMKYEEMKYFDSSSSINPEIRVSLDELTEVYADMVPFRTMNSSASGKFLLTEVIMPDDAVPAYPYNLINSFITDIRFRTRR